MTGASCGGGGLPPRLEALAAAFRAASGVALRFRDRDAFAAWLAAEIARTGARSFHADPWLPAVALPPGVARVPDGGASTAVPAEPLLVALTVDATLGDRPVPGVAERYPGRRRLLHLSSTLVLAVEGEPPRAAADGDPPGDLTFVAGPSRTADIEKVVVLGAHGPAACTLALIA